MKKVLSILMLLAIVVCYTSCQKANVDVDRSPQTHTGDGIHGEVFGIWTKGSVVRVTGDIIIPKDKTLTIEEGVLVIMDTLAKPEVIVLGNLYSKGTAENPVKITIEENYHTAKYKFGGQWGGLLVAASSTELLLDHTILEYGGATTTEASTSVKMGLYKAKSGENTPAIWYNNMNGKVVVVNSTFRYFKDDCTYMEGGKIIFSNNQFYCTGETGGEGINVKSGCLVDASYNLFFSTNTNAFKLSNSGNRDVQAHIVAYNNTMVNTGWRRPTVKGGSIWLEVSVYAETYNNLFYNTRFGIKRDTKNPEDARSISSHNLYYGYDQTTVNQFQPSADVINGSNNIRGTKANQNDPLLVNYPADYNTSNPDFNTSWDFRLKTGTIAAGAGTTSFKRNFPNGLDIDGTNYSSPAPSTTIGAFGIKN